jgi:hypothetical protein
MSERGSFYRKIIYLVLIAVLLFPISRLGAPETIEDEGGKLAQLRSENNLGQSNLGEIDPASETIRLATLGLRGIAVSMLWSKANEYKKKEDWTNFRATLQQLAKLQPYFISFWRYQAWNLSYNVSVELDDVRDRYYYVRRGIEFLQEGAKYNRDSPYLLSELGWFIGSKIGTADEKTEYRRLFKADDDYHPADRPPEQRDNWLVSRGWYEAAVSAVDDRKRSMGQKNPAIFYAAPGMAQINYSDAIEQEGAFGEKAKNAWATAGRLWRDFGNREIRASTGVLIRLASYDRWTEEGEQLQKQLESLVSGAREQLVAQRREELTPEERELLNTPIEALTQEQHEAYSAASQKLNVTPQDIAEYIAQEHPEKSAEARKLAHRIVENNERVRLTQNNRDVANYAYWEARCKVEQTPEALQARELAYAANQAFRDDADLLAAQRMYEQCFDLWAKVFADHPDLRLDSPSASDIMDQIVQYAKVLEQLDLNLQEEEINRRFPLWDLVEVNDNDGAFNQAVETHQRLMGSSGQ